MLILLSPAKRINTKVEAPINEVSRADFIGHAEELASILKSYSPSKLATLMGISDQLAVINAGRFADWDPSHGRENAKQAFFAFDGDVYRGLNAETLSNIQLNWAQGNVRILSGLYGILRPFDLIQPYRLEMGTRLPNSRGKDLYAFWSTVITNAIKQDLNRKKSDVLVNLASDEYSRVVNFEDIQSTVITPVFQEWKSGKWKVIPIHAKRARGLMVRFAVLNQIEDVTSLQAFDSEGYDFDRTASDDRFWYFRRRGI